MSELISVIVPVYNVKEYLEFCVNSIRNQTYTNMEIILVDDGSTDGSAELCDELAKCDKRIRVLHQTNQGAAAARNKGVDASKGDYISIIDGDDYIWPEMYDVLLEALKQSDADFACCPYEEVSEQKILESKYRITNPIDISILDKNDIYRHFYDHNTMWVIQPNKLYTKRMFEEYRFPHGHFYEDEYAAHRMLKCIKRAVYVNVPYYRYYIRQGSATKRGITSRQLFLLDALMDRIEYFREENEIEMLPIAESHFFEAYKSVAIGMMDRTANAKKELRRIRKQYRKCLRDSDINSKITKKLLIKRHLYIMMPRVMDNLIKIKNR